MTSTIYWNSPNQQISLSNTFEVNGTPTDPTTVSCVVTDPTGNSITYTYSPGTITRTGTGAYSLVVTCNPSVAGSYGLWTYVWIGTGTASDVSPGTFRTLPLSDAITGLQSWYCGLEELKGRLSIENDNHDYEVQLAIQATTNWITSYCSQHFYQVQEARGFFPYDLFEIKIDPLVSVTEVNLSFQGAMSGGQPVYDTTWGDDMYILYINDNDFNENSLGIPRPYTRIQVAGSPGPISIFPVWWPFTPKQRIQIVGTWGWPVVPPAVNQAALMLAADMYKMKDSPFGIANFGDFNMRVQSNPLVVELLRPYVRLGYGKKAGC
jgi:hypothetical protein